MRPDFSDFKDIYDAEKLKRDAARLKEKRARIFAKGAFDRSEDFDLGEDFEYCLMEAFHERGWFDESVSVSPGSQYDDMFYGIDLILAFRDDGDQGEPVYDFLAIDATVALDDLILEKKAEEARKDLRNGRMAIAEYFINDENPDMRGAIKMPKVVVSMVPAEAIELQNLLSRGKNLSFDDQKKLKLYKEKIIYQLTKGLESQIAFLREWENAASPGLKKELPFLRRKYGRLLELIKQKKKTG